jgi:hypothetical protein
MRNISSLAIIVSLILGATGIGVWAASRAHERFRVAGGLSVIPPPTFLVAPPALQSGLRWGRGDDQLPDNCL